jgi:hypothetical protein
MIKFEVNTKDVQALFKSAPKIVDQLAEDAYKFFIAQTPIKTGNARRSTDLDSKHNIVADYNYAERLDGGSSKQAPSGMTAPTERYMAQRLDQLTGKIK